MDAVKDRMEIDAILEEYADNESEDLLDRLDKIYQGYVIEFRDALLEKGYSKATCNYHAYNVYHYLDRLLSYSNFSLFSMWKGFRYFFGFHYVCHTWGSSVKTLNAYLCGMKRFLRFMEEKGYYTEKEAEEALRLIKENRGEWTQRIIDYRTPGVYIDYDKWDVV